MRRGPSLLQQRRHPGWTAAPPPTLRGQPCGACVAACASFRMHSRAHAAAALPDSRAHAANTSLQRNTEPSHAAQPASAHTGLLVHVLRHACASACQATYDWRAAVLHASPLCAHRGIRLQGCTASERMRAGGAVSVRDGMGLNGGGGAVPAKRRDMRVLDDMQLRLCCWRAGLVLPQRPKGTMGYTGLWKDKRDTKGAVHPATPPQGLLLPQTGLTPLLQLLLAAVQPLRQRCRP